MREHFPTVNAAEHDWINVADIDGLQEAKLQSMLDEFFKSSELLVEVHRRVGTVLPKTQVTDFVAKHLGQGQIQITNRDFTSFAVVAVNGVATAWSNTSFTKDGINA